MITLEEVKAHPAVKIFIEKANQNLAALGYTEHGFRHCQLVSRVAGRILRELGGSSREVELAAIAGYLHDIGNVLGRLKHDVSGSLITLQILKELGMPLEEIAEVITAIGNHDEDEGQVVSRVAAALILADKADVHRSRVRNPDFSTFDIHDRVNYAVESSVLEICPQKRVITLCLVIDTGISQVMEYFEIFLSRMVMCRRAASFLQARFSLVINNAELL
ncbi:MAG TPA: HD domain-containing protein [Firmicutes bacterium]|nr:HD domain-containing protein [Bacillota bacterium]